LKKKTYIFDEDTLEILDQLKCDLNQKEVSIIKDALRSYYEVQCNKKELYKTLNEVVSQLNHIVQKIEELSYALGQCRERNRQLEKILDELKRDNEQA